MPVIDFNEIPRANSGVGDQDTFELFARDFFEALGLEIISDPNRCVKVIFLGLIEPYL